LHSQSKSSPSPAPAYKIPGWVKAFAGLALVAAAIVAALHLAGLGMGHLAHGSMDADAPLAAHSQHQP
jgi:hypothetical protein